MLDRNQDVSLHRTPYWPTLKTSHDQPIDKVATGHRTDVRISPIFIGSCNGIAVDANASEEYIGNYGVECGEIDIAHRNNPSLQVKAKVKKVIDEGRGHEYYNIVLGDSPLGFLKLRSPNFDEQQCGNLMYGDPEGTKYLFIDNMVNYNAGDGVYKFGRALHQLAVEVSLQKGFGGKVIHTAIHKSHGFHLACGYESLKAEGVDLTQLIRDALDKIKRENREPVLPPIPMYLPSTRIEAYIRNIETAPILNE